MWAHLIVAAAFICLVSRVRVSLLLIFLGFFFFSFLLLKHHVWFFGSCLFYLRKAEISYVLGLCEAFLETRGTQRVGEIRRVECSARR
jgi:hypothetical protein